jgi:hypothetical protein
MTAALIVIGVLALIFLSTWIFARGGRSRVIRAAETLPASAFPERADVYVCDKCGRDVTKHFHPSQSHTWAPMGPARFVCRCGQTYVTGAIEWDHLGPSERRRRVRQTLGIGVLLSAMFSILGVLAYLALRFLFDLRKAGFIVALFITAVPFVWLQLDFWPAVVASMWRTRAGSSVERA